MKKTSIVSFYVGHTPQPIINMKDEKELWIPICTDRDMLLPKLPLQFSDAHSIHATADRINYYWIQPGKLFHKQILLVNYQ